MSLRGLREQNKTRMKVDWNSLWPFRNSKDAKHRLGRVFQRFQSDRFFVVGNKCLLPLRTGRSMNLSFSFVHHSETSFHHSENRWRPDTDQPGPQRWPQSILIRLRKLNINRLRNQCFLNVNMMFLWPLSAHWARVWDKNDIRPGLPLFGSLLLSFQSSFPRSSLQNASPTSSLLTPHSLLPCQICPPQPTFSGFYISLLIQKTYYQAPSIDSCQRYAHSSFHDRI